MLRSGAEAESPASGDIYFTASAAVAGGFQLGAFPIASAWAGEGTG